MIFIKKNFIFILNKINIIFIKNGYKKNISKIFYKYFFNIKIFFKLLAKFVTFYIILFIINI